MLSKITKTILSQIPENVKLNNTDIVLLQKHKGFIVGLNEKIATRFYDILFANEVTKAIFKEGERPIREASLKRWIVKTFDSEFDDKYWEWQTFVGILHIKRAVKNNMMVTMIGAVTEIIIEEVINALPKDEAILILKAWIKLSGIITSLVVEGYRLFYMVAIENVTGLTAVLLENVVKTEIDNLIADNQKYRI